MVVGVSDTTAFCQQEWPIFYAVMIKYLSIMWTEDERHILPAGCVTAP